MAESRESTILDVKLDAGKVAQDLQDLITRIAALKAQQKSLNEEIKAGNDVDGKYAEQLIRVKDQLAWTEKQAKGLSATTKLLNADTLTYSDSLNGERQKLADMQKAYDQLDRTQRESEGGRAFLEAIKAQSDAVKGLEEETGRAQRNVGNYPESWGNVIPGLNKATKVLSTMGLTMEDLGQNGTKAFASLGSSLKTFGKGFLTPPIIVITAVLSAIMFAVQKVSEAFKKNDDAMTAVTKAFAIFQPIGDGVAKVFDWVAQGLAKVAEGAAKVVQWIAGKVAPGYAAAAEKAQELVKAQDDLEDAERKYTEQSAKRNAQIAELRAKAIQAERYSSEERKQFLQDAIALEKQNLDEQKNMASERVRILEETAKKESDTSDETKNKIAQARAAMFNAEEQYYSGVRRLNSQLTQFEKEENSARVEAWAQEWENKRLLAEAEASTLVERSKELQERAQAMLESLTEDEEEEEIPTPDEISARIFGLDAEGVEYFRSLLDQGVNFSEAKTKAIADQTMRMTRAWGNSFGSLGKTFDQMSDALGEFAGESKEAAAAQKAFAFGGIIMNQAQSISEGALAVAKGVESAAGIPFPGNIPAIIAIVAQIGGMIAGVMSSIAQAKQIFAQADSGKFATGGVVGGSSYTGDKLIAHVNSGEGIYTGTQANNILQEIANNPARGGIDYGQMTEAMVAAVEALPAQVLVLKELREANDKVTTFNEIASI